MATGENVLALQQCQIVGSSVVLNTTTNEEEPMIVFESGKATLKNSLTKRLVRS